MLTWFRNRRTATKLAIAFSLLVLLVGVAGAASVLGVRRIRSDSADLFQKHAWGLYQLTSAGHQLTGITAELYRMVYVDVDAEAVRRRVVTFDASVEDFRKSFAEYEGSVTKAQDRQQIASLRARFDALLAFHEEIERLLLDGKAREARAALARFDGRLAEIRQEADRLEQDKLELMNVTTGEVDDLCAALEGYAMWLAALVVAGAVASGFVLTRMIARPLGGAAQVLDAVAAGDFTRRLEIDSQDEVGHMGRALNQAVGRITEALLEIRARAGEVASAAAQMAGSSGRLADGAQQQAASLEQTTATLAEIADTVRRNAESAGRATRVAEASRESAEKGGQAVGAAVAAMAEIDGSAKRIADIITVIDEIAFQTNLLALNAAVEAARAREHGRGFAVVAAEVRVLAQRAATAAREIKALIQDAVHKAAAGTDLVNRSGKTLEDIVDSVNGVSGIVGEIAQASSGQASGIEQLNQAVRQMDQVTQSNSAQTRQLSAAAIAMSGQAAQLRALAGRFRLNKSGAGPGDADRGGERR